MIIPEAITSWQRSCFRGALCLAAGLFFVTMGAFADAPVTMAPPIDETGVAQIGVGMPGNASPDSVFRWQEVPANQRVPITRATFDQGGYQLYDTAGETIIIPFTNHNLYVMKFAPSLDGTMYFVNAGDSPILYVPKNGYLENAAVSGARWYPFSPDFHPAQPVYLGIAPSYPAFINMGWYPNMYSYGGYWCNTSFVAGGIFLPSFGLFFDIGGRPYSGWHGYRSYCAYHPAPYRETYYQRDFYRWAERPAQEHREFTGSDREWTGHTTDGSRYFGRDRYFGGDVSSHGSRVGEIGGRHVQGTTNAPVYVHQSLSDDRALHGTERVLAGTSQTPPATRPFTGSRTLDEGHAAVGGSHRPFEGGQPALGSGWVLENNRPSISNGRSIEESLPISGGNHAISSGRTFEGGSRVFANTPPAFGGSGHVFHDRPTLNNGPAFGSSPSFGVNQPTMGGSSFSNSPSMSAGHPSFGGNHNDNGGGRSFSNSPSIGSSSHSLGGERGMGAGGSALGGGRSYGSGSFGRR